VRALAASPDGKWLATGVRYGAVKVFSTDGFRLVHTLEPNSDDVNALVFTPDSTQFLAALGRWNRPSEVQGWDVGSGQTTKRFQHTGEVLSLAISSDGGVVAAGGGDHAISIWPMPSAAGERH
jgi:WD40 repeat protein